MSKPLELMVWMPLQSQLAWKGEGIARTVENILKFLPRSIMCHLVINVVHANALSDFIAENPHIHLHMVGIKRSKKMYCLSDKDTQSVNTLFDLIVKKIPFISNVQKGISKYYHTFVYLSTLYITILLQRLNLFLPHVRLIWAPVPNIPGLTLLKGKKICSFWDPFVFEYAEFDGLNNILSKKFNALYQTADQIITQSSANKDFLMQIFQKKDDQVTKIHNGSPDYVRFFNELKAVGIGRRDKDSLLAAWMHKQYTGRNRIEALEHKTKDLLNKTVLWRLLVKLTIFPSDKVLMISTQYRPYKGFDLLLHCLNELVKQESTFKYHFIFTAQLPKALKAKYFMLYERIHEMTRVSDKQHALLYYISDLVLHPSYVEGGLGVYPQFEAASMGTPTIANIGRHILEQSPNTAFTDYACDFTDIATLLTKITRLIVEPAERDRNLLATRSLVVPCQHTSQQYADIFKQVANA